ncbi:MAG: hypothetical protein RL557_1050 [archaeon]|jgi:hypothetical protein
MTTTLTRKPKNRQQIRAALYSACNEKDLPHDARDAEMGFVLEVGEKFPPQFYFVNPDSSRERIVSDDLCQKVTRHYGDSVGSALKLAELWLEKNNVTGLPKKLHIGIETNNSMKVSTFSFNPSKRSYVNGREGNALVPHTVLTRDPNLSIKLTDRHY